MHLDDAATDLAEQSWDAEIESLSQAAMLPVHVPDAGRGGGFDATASIGSDEVRGLLAVVRRLDGLVEEETIALETRKKIDFDDFSIRKSRSMLEFVRLMRGQIQLGGDARVAREIKRLRERLERNRAVLEMHLEATREVAAIIIKAIREAESDGTYSGNAMQERK